MQRNNIVHGAPQACAACKHQRKKCTNKCILAPLFPADKAREFQAVHKIFGVSNLQKLVRNLNEEDRKRAVDSLVWEALCRQKDPILGPYGEYRRIYDELKFYKLNQSQQIVSSATLAHGSLVTKSTNNNGLIGWNFNNGSLSNKMNTNTINGCVRDNAAIYFGHTNGNMVLGDSGAYNGYPASLFQAPQKSTAQDNDVGSIGTPQQHMTNSFNQQYYLSGINAYT